MGTQRNSLGRWGDGEGAFKMQMSIVKPEGALLLGWDPFVSTLQFGPESLKYPGQREVSNGLKRNLGPPQIWRQQRGCSVAPDEGRPQLWAVPDMVEPRRL